MNDFVLLMHMRRHGVNRKPVIESIKDYSLAIALFVFGLFLIWLTFYVAHLYEVFFVAIAGICSILASFVSAALMRFFHL
jgi:hypothetical protein